MRLPDPLDRYDRVAASAEKQILESADAQNYKKGNDVEIGSIPAETRKQRLILRGSVNGNRYAIGINDTTSGSPVLTMTLL